MSCPRTADVLLIDSEWATASQRELETHAADCAPCKNTMLTIREARAVGKQISTPEMNHALRERVWDRTTRPRRSGALPIGLALAAAAAVVAFVAVRTPTPPTTTVARSAPSPMNVLVREGEIERTDHGVARLELGWVEIDLRPTTTPIRVVETPHAMVSGSSLSIVVRTNDVRTSLEVVAGRARITALDGSVDRWISAGERIVVGRPPETTTAPPVKKATRIERPRTKRPAEMAPATPLVAEAEPATEPSPRAAQRDRIRDARRVVKQNPRAASAIALALIDEQPEPSVEVGAMIVVADAYRRSGRTEEAAEWYERVVRHSAGRAYVEEASLRRAELLLELGRTDDALRALTVEAVANALLPERLALRAKIYVATGDRRAAQESYEAAIRAARAAGDDALAETLARRQEQVLHRSGR